MNYTQMVSRLAIMMGGRVAEELINGKEKVTSGASSDISAATSLARNMVTRWGYSDELGLVSYGDNQEEVFLGHSVARTQNVSEATAQKIDEEVRRLVTHGYNEAKRILSERIDDLHVLAKTLLEYETLSGEEIQELLKSGARPKREDQETKRPSGPAVAVPISPRPGAEPEPA
jgi:cell division protease FtsH